MSNDEATNLIKLYAYNTRSLEEELNHAGGSLRAIGGMSVEDFLITLAKNNIKITAQYTGELT